MNDGKGIPVEMHKEHDMFVPTLIFGHLLTSSNYDDSQKKVRLFLRSALIGIHSVSVDTGSVKLILNYLVYC